MQDPRLRLASVLALSVAAFATDAGAVLAMIWWAAMSLPRSRPHLPGRAAITVWLMVAAVAIVIGITGGSGVSYLLRMSAVLLIASFAFREQRGGEVLQVAVWLGGTGAGFELGLLAELAIQSLRLLERDIEHMKTAAALKKSRWGIAAALAMAQTLIIGQLQRSDEQARILARRGYRYGGTLCPVFAAEGRDKIAAICAFALMLFALIPVRDVFIVIQ